MKISKPALNPLKFEFIKYFHPSQEMPRKKLGRNPSLDRNLCKK